MICKTCTQYLHRLTNGKKSCPKLGISLIWREQTNQGTNCFYITDLTGINRKNWRSLKCPDLESAHCPVAHRDEIPLPVFGEFPDISDKESSSLEENAEVVLDNDAAHPY